MPVDEHQRLALVESMIAEGDRVDARGEKLLEYRFGDPEAAGGVLSIDDDEVETPSRTELRNLLNDRRTPRSPDDIANE